MYRFAPGGLRRRGTEKSLLISPVRLRKDGRVYSIDSADLGTRFDSDIVRIARWSLDLAFLCRPRARGRKSLQVDIQSQTRVISRRFLGNKAALASG